MQLTDFPVVGSTLSRSWMSFVTLHVRSIASARATLAGAFQTPRALSTLAYTPAIAGLGGSVTSNLSTARLSLLYAEVLNADEAELFRSASFFPSSVPAAPSTVCLTATCDSL